MGIFEDCEADKYPQDCGWTQDEYPAQPLCLPDRPNVAQDICPALMHNIGDIPVWLSILRTMKMNADRQASPDVTVNLQKKYYFQV